jgi:uncharacterized membrane protein YphA (DoxX/SURF4 family)
MAPDISKVDTGRHLDPGPSARNFRDDLMRFFMGNRLSDPKHLLIPFIRTDRLRDSCDSCASTSKNRKNRLRCPVLLCPSQTGTASIGTRFTMNTNASPTQNLAGQPPAANGLAMVRLTIGAMLVWVFFENLGKGLYTPAGYAGLINYYIKASHSPAAWKAVMGLMASHAAMAAPMQAMAEISLGVLLVIGLLTRPVAFVAFLYLASLWISEWGTSWIWELLVPVLASLALAVGRAGRAWGVDALLARRWPSSPWW